MIDALADCKPQHEVVIDTQRLRLRPMRASDLKHMHALRVNPAVMEFMS
jgi:RimJ/RimL family protein N-acetyltransferase